MERSRHVGRGVSWSHKETQALLAVWSEDRIQRHLEVSVRNEDVYGEMSARLAAVGVSRSAKQCRAKLKKLKREYRQFKQQFVSGETLTSETFEWFYAMDSVISDRPAAVTDNTGQMVLELMISDVKTESPSATNIPENFSTSSSCSMENLQEPVFYPSKLDDSVAPSLTPPLGQTSAMWSPSPLGRRKDRRTCSWSKNEVLVLLTHWANSGVQQELRRNVRNNAVYNSLSAKLATLGFSKSAQKCKEKLKKLKQDYKRIKNSNHLDGGKNMWFNIIDQVLSSQPAETLSPAEPTHPVGLDVNTETPSFETSLFETCTVRSPSPCPEICKDPDIYLVKLGDSDTPTASTSVSPPAVQSSVMSPRRVEKKRYAHVCSWSKKEVHVLLAYWANPAVQQELRRNVRNNAVYSSLSAKLASFGFDKSPQKCKEKIKKLKQDYRKIRKSRPMSWRRTAWFGILDKVLGSQPAALKCSEPTQPVVLDLETNDVNEWLPDEVQVLVTLWAQPNIQKQLLTSGTHSDVFTYLSNELALIGFNKTPQQCSVKVNRLKEVYQNIKRVEPHGNHRSNWFAVMDGVLGPEAETPKDINPAAALIAPESPEDSSQAAWTSEEVGALLTLWAEEGVQERLKSPSEDERLYAQLSSELATQGFDKTTSQCRTKIRLLEQEYERIKEENYSKAQKSSWFAIVDQNRGCPKPKTETKLAAESLQVSQPTEGCRLSIPSLCLLVPTLRLMCAFAWQVVQCCNVALYKKVEELVLLVTELAPELLTAKERVQLLLRLRARLVLELCRSESVPDLLNVQPHLRIIQDLTMSSGCGQEELVELEKSKSNFVGVVHTLLDDPDERKRFFMEVFPIHYGQQFEATLQTLVWKFISRLDNLLPVPDIKQTAEWLSSAPSVMEECGQMVLEREQLKELLHFHQQQTGNANNCFSQAQNLFLPLLSLHPKTNSRQHEPSVGENNSWVNCSKDKEPLEKNLAGDVLTVKDSGTGNDLEDSQNLKPFELHHCSMCSYSDSRVAALLQHIQQEHLVQESSPLTEAEDDLNIDAPFGGPIDSEFSSEILKDIVTPDSQGPPFQCEQCEKKYLSKSSLIVHHRVHTSETPFLCSVCGQGFRCSSHLKLHARTHTGERRFSGHVCGKTSVQHLMRHMRMHRGEKNHLCTECGKAFLSSGELRLHLRSHSGERPYTCRHCGKGFIAKCLLTVHTCRHTGQSPYRCSLCPKAFPTLRAQKQHLKIHTDKKSYQCLKCGKIFRQEDTFKLHVKTHNLI